MGPLSPGPLSPTSPISIPQHFFSREESQEIPETPGFKLLKDLSEHIERRTGQVTLKDVKNVKSRVHWRGQLSKGPKNQSVI